MQVGWVSPVEKSITNKYTQSMEQCYYVNKCTHGDNAKYKIIIRNVRNRSFARIFFKTSYFKGFNLACRCFTSKRIHWDRLDDKATL